MFTVLDTNHFSEIARHSVRVKQGIDYSLRRFRTLLGMLEVRQGAATFRP